MELITNWINCILIVIVIIGIIEIIVPEGETKKFVFLITEVTVSIVIAMPVLKFFKSDFSFKDVFNVSYIETNDFYIDTLRSTVDRQANMLETIYADSVKNEFNSTYKDMQILECKITFTRDFEGKIVEINLIDVVSSYGGEDENLLKTRIASICEVDKEKVRVS